MIVKLLIEHYLVFLSLEGGYTVYDCRTATLLGITCRGLNLFGCSEEKKTRFEALLQRLSPNKYRHGTWISIRVGMVSY